MRIVIEKSADEVSQFAAARIARLIRQNPACVLGLATGSTPLRTYQELIRLHRQEELDFSKITTFNLDEYVGLSPDHPQSYRYFMQSSLFDHVNVRPEATHVPDGLASDLNAHCLHYEADIRAQGGIDLQLLGVGTDGHIAFNEPSSSLASRTRIKSLTRETVRDNARFFENESEVPRLALTMGVGTILESRECLLLATGENKAEAVQATIEGPVTAQITASALQLHANTILVIDEAAASRLERQDYYREVESAQRQLEATLS
jgi:glucosamine-6-phosphate deaminase